MTRAAAVFLTVILVFLSPLKTFGQGAVVLALSGGGMRGLAHIGVLKALQEKNIPVAGIVGTSMGAVIGGLAAAGYSPLEIEDIVRNVDMASVILGKGDSLLPHDGETDISPLMPRREMSSSWKTTGPKGVLTGVGAYELFLRLTSRISVSRFDELPIPFAAVATDIQTGKRVVIREGSLASAMRASMSIPGVFEPWPLDGKLLVDGGLVSNMPVRAAKSVFPGYPVVAVNVSSGLRTSDQMITMTEVIDQTITILTSQNVAQEQSEADILIRPDVGFTATLGAVNTDKIIDLGEKAALEQMDRIAEAAMAAPPVDRPSPGPVQAVASIEVEGVPVELADRIKRKYQYWVGNPVSPEEISKASDLIRIREDVRTVGHVLADGEDGVKVIFKVQREPENRFTLVGYANNILGGRWLGVRGTLMDFMADGNYLNIDALLGDDWAAKLDYYFGVEKNFYRLSAQAARISMSPRNAEASKWDARTLSVTRGFSSGFGRTSVGLMATHVKGEGTEADTWGPMAEWLYDGSGGNGRERYYLGLKAWYPEEGGEVMLRAEGSVARVLSPVWRAYLTAGFAEGNSDGRYVGQALYLGGREELFSLAEYPIRGERLAWWRMGFRRRLGESQGSPWEAEFFGGQGYVWNDDGSMIDDPWELGVALTVPSNLLRARLMAVYNDSTDWTFGFTIGDPLWSTRQIFP